MGKLILTEDEQKLLINTFIVQKYASEVVEAEIREMEVELKPTDEDRMRQLVLLFQKLHKAGC